MPSGGLVGGRARRAVDARAGGVGGLGSLLGTAPRPDRGSRVRVTGDLEVRAGGPEGVVGGCQGRGVGPLPNTRSARKPVK